MMEATEIRRATLEDRQTARQEATDERRRQQLLAEEEKARQEQQMRQEAEHGIQLLQEVADSGNLGPLNRGSGRVLGISLGGAGVRDVQKIENAVSSLMPALISRLRAAGKSGINTAAQVRQAVGLVENPTSEQVGVAVENIRRMLNASNSELAAMNLGGTPDIPSNNDPLGIL